MKLISFAYIINSYHQDDELPGLPTFFRQKLKAIILLKMEGYFFTNIFIVDILTLIEKLVQEAKKYLTERNSHPVFTVKNNNQVEEKDSGAYVSQPATYSLSGGSSVLLNMREKLPEKYQNLTINIEKGALKQIPFFLLLNQVKML